MDTQPTIDLEQIRRYDRPGPRYTSYPTAVEFHALGAGTYARHLAAADAVDQPFAVYMHLPFCEARCLYCACHAIICPDKSKAAPYLGVLAQEIDLVASHLPTRRRVAELHLGGGTPTYHEPAELVALMDAVRRRFDVAETAELSVESDPRVTTTAHLRALADSGFRRISLGVQDFDPAVQEAIGRVQSFEETWRVVRESRDLGFAGVNIDLVYGLPHQTPEGLERTMDRVLTLDPDRLAVYSFAYVPWLKGNQRKIAPDTVPGTEARLGLIATVRERLTGAGLVEIGMDHFARPEDPLAVAQRAGRLRRNFMGYTTTAADDILAFGVSAIGYVCGAYVQNAKKLSAWRSAIEHGVLATERGVVLDADDRVRAHVIRELMCNFRVEVADVERRFRIGFADYFADDLRALQPLRDDGLVEQDAAGLRVIGAGRTLVRTVAMCFDRYRREDKQAGPRFSRVV